MKLTGKAKEDFLKQKKWYFIFFTENIKNIIIYRWFNTKTKIKIDIQYLENDGFDYAVQHPFLNEVYLSNKKAGKRTLCFDENLKQSIQKANEIYNNVK